MLLISFLLMSTASATPITPADVEARLCRWTATGLAPFEIRTNILDAEIARARAAAQGDPAKEQMVGVLEGLRFDGTLDLETGGVSVRASGVSGLDEARQNGLEMTTKGMQMTVEGLMQMAQQHPDSPLLLPGEPVTVEVTPSVKGRSKRKPTSYTSIAFVQESVRVDIEPQNLLPLRAITHNGPTLTFIEWEDGNGCYRPQRFTMSVEGRPDADISITYADVDGQRLPSGFRLVSGTMDPITVDLIYGATDVAPASVPRATETP